MLICGRQFAPSEIDWIRSQIENRPELKRAELSRLFCRYAQWRKSDGGNAKWINIPQKLLQLPGGKCGDSRAALEIPGKAPFGQTFMAKPISMPVVYE